MAKYWLGVLSVIFLTGCLELDTTSSTPGQPGAEGETESENGTPALSGADQGDWGSIQWYTSRGPSGAGATQVMTLDAEISSDGRFVNFVWDRFPWSGNARGHFFVWNGSNWEGGMFEWITPGGQSVKTLSNIRNGYNGLSAPAPGTRVAFAWTNEQGTERSNLAVTTWR